MPKTYIPVDTATREEMYDVKRGFTWDELLGRMLSVYKTGLRRKARAVRQRGGATRQRGRKQDGKSPKARRGVSKRVE